MPPKKSQTSSTTTNDEKVEWSPVNEAAFIEIMHAHVKQGELQCSTFKPKTWLVIDEEMFAKSRKRYGVEKLKAKFNRLRKRHREFSDLIRSSGFGWDPVSNTVTVVDEVWDADTKKHPTTKGYQKKGLDHYEVLGEIFNTTTATGQLRYSSNQIPLDSDEDRAVKEELLNAGVHVDLTDDNEDAHFKGETSGEVRKQSRRSGDSCSSRGTTRGETYDVLMAEMIGEIQTNKELRKGKASEEQLFSTDECVKFLKSFEIPSLKLAKLLNNQYLLNFEFRKLVMGLEADDVKVFIETL